MRGHHRLDEPANHRAAMARVIYLWKSFWALPTLLILAALLVTGGLVIADGAGLAAWLDDHGIRLVSKADDYREAVAVIAGVNAAFTTLYFSITLLVLTIAASNLGVRLIDRWIARTFVRATLGLLLAATGASLFLLMIFTQAGGSTLPHASLLFLAALLVVILIWLAVALNDLGRAIFVDTAIDSIARDAIAEQPADLRAIPDPDWDGIDDCHHVGARWDGYIMAVDIDALDRLAERWDTMFRVERAAGDHLVEGEAVIIARNALNDDQADAVRGCLTISQTRSDQEGLSYRIRLLVEIAARALSPAINDFYTARACVDSLAAIMRHQRRRIVPKGQILIERTRVLCPTASFEQLFDAPVAALRQAAADYPVIAIRFIDRCGVAATLEGDAAFTAKMQVYARAMADHATLRADFHEDKDALAAAMARQFG